MAYGYTRKDLMEAWRRWRAMAEPIYLHAPDQAQNWEDTPAGRFVSALYGSSWVSYILRSGVSSKTITRQQAPGAFAPTPVFLMGKQQLGTDAIRSRFGEHGVRSLLGYQALFSAIGLRENPFTLYAVREEDAAYPYHHISESGRGLGGTASQWRSPLSFALGIAQHTAPVYQFAFQAGNDFSPLKANIARAARQAGMPEELARGLAKGSNALKLPGRHLAMSSIVTVAHEFAHGVIQAANYVPFETIRSYASGQTALADIVATSALSSGFLDEGQADVFAMGVSMDPGATVSMRYHYAVRSMLVGQTRMPQGFRYGNWLRLRVIDPSTVESKESPLYQMLKGYVERHESSLIRPVENGRTLDYSSVLDRQRMLSDSGELKMEAALPFLNSVAHMAKQAIEGLRRAYMKGEIVVQDEDVRTLLEYQPNRLWSVSYAVGKVRPDLIGKELLVHATGGIIAADTGEYIDLGKIGLPELKVTTLWDERQDVHPVALERGMRAVDLYERARVALRSGQKFHTKAEMTAEQVIESWRDMLWKVGGRR